MRPDRSPDTMAVTHSAPAQFGAAARAQRVDGGLRASSPQTLRCQAPKREDTWGLGEPPSGARTARSASSAPGRPSGRRRSGGAAPPRRSQRERAGKSLFRSAAQPTGREAPVVGGLQRPIDAGSRSEASRGGRKRDFPAREAAPEGGGRRAAGRPKGAQRPPEPACAGVRASSRGVQPRQRGKSARSAPAGGAAPSVLAMLDFDPLQRPRCAERVVERIALPHLYLLDAGRRP